jgi:hypothetical protein
LLRGFADHADGALKFIMQTPQCRVALEGLADLFDLFGGQFSEQHGG